MKQTKFGGNIARAEPHVSRGLFRQLTGNPRVEVSVESTARHIPSMGEFLVCFYEPVTRRADVVTSGHGSRDIRQFLPKRRGCPQPGDRDISRPSAKSNRDSVAGSLAAVLHRGDVLRRR